MMFSSQSERSVLPKRGIAIVSSLMFVATLVPSNVFAFSDVTTKTSYSTAINALQTNGILIGYQNGTFKPNQTITRAEFLKIIMEAIKPSVTDYRSANCAPSDVTGQPSGIDPGFSDVKDTDWFSSYTCLAKHMNIVNGYDDGTFKPNQTITFVEAAKILSLAYKQQVNQNGGAWWQPYATALEASKAIPPSIAKLDAPLTRGEMAEMIWRISEKKTDQPTKGILNIEHPGLSFNSASDSVQTAKSCADIQAFAAESATMNSVMNQGGGILMRGAMTEGVMAPMAMDAQKTTSTANVAADHSETNVQVEGVDEADMVKTDGTNLYVATGQKIQIVKAQPASDMKIVSTIDLTDANMNVQDLYLDTNRLIVLGSNWGGIHPLMMEKRVAGTSYMPIYQQSRQEVRIYDVSNAAAPKLVRTISIEGSTISSRRINDKLYLVLQSSLYRGGPIPLDAKAATLLPQIADSKNGSVDAPVTNCASVSILPRIPSPSYLTVAVIPTQDVTAEVKTKVIVGDGQNIYASLQNLYVATTQWAPVWDSANPTSTETTNVYRFQFTDNGVDLKAQGSVPGQILNQFSMDENASTFRIATTSNQNFDETNTSKNNLYVLNMDLQTVGSLTDLAPGESIYAVRFMGDRAYLVTFKTVDPLFVIDTSDARNPKLLGKLKIPGYSNYLQPYDATHLIGFGKDVDESIDADKVHTPGAVYYTAVQGMKMAMFDVSDVANPKELWNTTIGDRGTDSPLLYDHHALLFEKDSGLLAFPVGVYEIPASEKQKKPAEQQSNETFQGAYVYNVSLDKGFDLKGKITHYTSDDLQKSGNYLYGKDVSRIVRVNDSLLTVGQDGVQSHTTVDISYQNKVTFPDDQVVSPIKY